MILNNFFFVSVFFTALSLTSLSFAAKPSPEELLKSADRARGGLSEGLTWKLKLESHTENQNSDFEYQVQVKNSFVLAKCLSPARSKDEIFLFLDKSLWIHKPGLKNPMSLSTRQKLIGTAANGDIATTNYSRDYEPKILGEETISKVKTWKLLLKAKSKDLTYDQIHYWISQDKMLGVQAEYLTLQNEVFKKAYFEYSHQIKVADKTVPFISKLTIEDAKNPKLKSILTYTQPQITKLDDSLFNVNKLGK